MYQACDALWHAAVQVVLVLVLVLVLAGHTKLWLDSLSLFRSFSASRDHVQGCDAMPWMGTD